MNINTNKLASNSNHFLKKLKEMSGTSQKDSSKEKIIKKLKSDFSDIISTNNSFKARLLNNNKKLSQYENEITKLQFMSSKRDEIYSLLSQNADPDQVFSVINNSLYDQQAILKPFFPDKDNIVPQLENLNQILSQTESTLEKDFKAIEIASQNILSIHSINYSEDNQSAAFQDLDFQNLIQHSNLDTKRVLDLIS
ncbi:MAG: hypothetical protein MJB14_21400 [Spirochaetes bacterium]|nr:hypothetical protein [Spirochaetota bacterium]